MSSRIFQYPPHMEINVNITAVTLGKKEKGTIPVIDHHKETINFLYANFWFYDGLFVKTPLPECRGNISCSLGYRVSKFIFIKKKKNTLI